MAVILQILQQRIIQIVVAPVNYGGEPVAIVVADTEQHARHAALKVTVLYAPKPPNMPPPPAPSTSSNTSSNTSDASVKYTRRSIELHRCQSKSWW